MRIFLGLLLFDMTFRSFSILYPWTSWAKELEMPVLPTRFPTAAERQRLAEQTTPEDPQPVRTRNLQTLTSLRDYLAPWPTPQTRQHLDGPSAWGKYGLTWLASRLGLFERVIGFDNRWFMFSPTVSDENAFPRARLFYADGSEQIERIHGDPIDLNAYSHWNEDKIVNYERVITPEAGREDECFGWCNWLAPRRARNGSGSPLVKVRLFMVTYHLAPPRVDPRVWYERQMLLTPDHVPPGTTGPDKESKWQTDPDFYEFDVAQHKGRSLKD